VLERCRELGAYAIDTDRQKDWEKDPSPIETHRGSELTHDVHSDRVSIVLVAGKHRKDLIRSIKSVIGQTDKDWNLYVIGAGNPVLEAVMENSEFKRKNIFWWNLESLRTEVREKTCINYALKMIITSDYITYMRSGTEWGSTHLEDLSSIKESDVSIIKTGESIENLCHTRNLLVKSGYYDKDDEEFIERLNSSA